MGSPQLCVYCRKRPVDHAWRPFCSERCKVLDLARWAEGSYRIPAEPVTTPDDAEAEDEAGDGGPKAT